MLYIGQTHAALVMLNRPGKSIAEGFACDAQTGLADGHQLLETTPDRIRVPPTLPGLSNSYNQGTTQLPGPTGQGLVSLFTRGLSAARRQLGQGCIWRRLWLRPSDLPGPYPGIKIVFHRNPKPDILPGHYIPSKGEITRRWSDSLAYRPISPKRR